MDNHEMLLVRGARTHNLKNVNLDVPKHKIVVFTGVSGSGKSSLVFDTIYTESQRQLIETFSSFARRRLPKLSRPPVDDITNLSTAIVIDQKRMGRTLRSTVGTATEAYTYLRLLFSRFADPFIGPSFLFSFNHPDGMCKECRGLGKRIRVDVDLLVDKTLSLREGAITHPDFKVDGWNWRELLGCGLFDGDRKLGTWSKQDLDTLLHADGVPIKKTHGAGVYAKKFEGIVRKLERLYVNKAEDELPEARRNAYDRYFVYADCDVCRGSRLCEKARQPRLLGRSIDECTAMEVEDLDPFLAGVAAPGAAPILRKLRQILGSLVHIGVGYLSLGRAVSTLSGGESQRVKMARQLNCDLMDMLYILDEPSIGLHPRDTGKLVELLAKLRDKGNSVYVVEHDADVMKSADWIVDMGPQAGRLGGNVLFTGTYAGLMEAKTLTAQHLRGRAPKSQPRKPAKEWFEVNHANAHNLKDVSVRIPKGVLTCITGVAGSGKSSLIHEVFVQQHPEAIVVDQSPVAKSSRSIPLTFLGVFDAIRKELSKATGIEAGLFSFNSDGACPKCHGMGEIQIEMSFMDDVAVPCEECRGRRYKPEVLEAKYKDKSIDEILHLTAADAVEFFTGAEIAKRLRVMCEVGLTYLEIGQSLSSLSGGEAQRLKLAAELHKRGNTYVMDEPTTGLHMADIDRLMGIIRRLVDHNNSVIVIEHNLDVIRQADWIIDMGPLGGKNGGTLVAHGTPEEVARCPASFTGQCLGL